MFYGDTVMDIALDKMLEFHQNINRKLRSLYTLMTILTTRILSRLIKITG